MKIDNDFYSIESVTSGHPDKICDQISDAILDEYLKEDPKSRVAVESFGGHGLIIVGGEVTTTANVDYQQVARDVYSDIGHKDKMVVLSNISEQSPNIAMGVDSGGAGDQGIMYGLATNECDDYLPFGVGLVNKLTRGLEKLRKSGTCDWIMPDGKAQLTIKGGKVLKALVSTQHTEDISQEKIKSELIEKLFTPVLGDLTEIDVLVNPTGEFSHGGFYADTGLTGRKLMVDTYGGMFPHGGGCFSGKDATKVDRSAAYMCRFVAKNLVANGYANKAMVSVAYAIGVAEPLMVWAKDENDKDLSDVVKKNFDFKPLAIIERLELRKPIFRKTAVYGHFTDSSYPWEQIVKI